MKKIIIPFILVSFISLSFATQQPKEVKPKEQEQAQAVKKRCKFNDFACKKKPDSRATRALKRINKF
jgi:hypothetical protein